MNIGSSVDLTMETPGYKQKQQNSLRAVALDSNVDNVERNVKTGKMLQWVLCILIRNVSY